MTGTKIALITGASRGFGRSAARHLLDNGISIIGTFHTGTAEAEQMMSQSAATGSRLAFLPFDAARTAGFGEFTASVEHQLHNWGEDGFDYLVNNAGIGYFAPYPETTEEQFDELIAVNVKGPYFLTQRLLPLLRDGGRILNLSTALTKAVVPGGSAYAATKGAIEVLTRYQAVELAARGIRVTTVRGGATISDFGGGIMRSPAVQEHSAKVIALGRVGTPDDLGAAIPALLSEAFDWSTGGCVDINGGQSL